MLSSSVASKKISAKLIIMKTFRDSKKRRELSTVTNQIRNMTTSVLFVLKGTTERGGHYPETSPQLLQIIGIACKLKEI